jgi:mRNA interferase RelE/StbE
MTWRIEFDPRAEKELLKLGHDNARRIAKFLMERVAVLNDPRSIGEALHGPDLGRFWKYRVGDYRVIVSIKDAALIVLVVRVGNRREVYR